MRDDLELATQNLYSVFSRYARPQKIAGCPCCVTDRHRAALHAKLLNDLEDGDLSYYVFKAMTTFGNREDFKYFLPRILELSASDELSVDTSVLLGKLDTGNWLTWPKDEQVAVTHFLSAWWKFTVNTNRYFDPELLVELYKLQIGLSSLLEVWKVDYNTPGLQNFVDLVVEHSHNIVRCRRDFKAFDQTAAKQCLDWIGSKAQQLREILRDKPIDPELSGRIQQALYIIETYER